jgi:hypothetical protein
MGCDICYLPVYIDEILLTGSNSTLVQRFVTLLSSEFKLRDLGSTHYFLGIEVTPTGMGLKPSQHKYVLDILYHAGMPSNELVDTTAFASKLGLQSSE